LSQSWSGKFQLPQQVVEARAIDAGLLESWALAYLERYASSAANLRRVLMRRARRRLGAADRDRIRSADALIDALVARYREAQLLDDAAYAAARARRDLARGRSLPQIIAGLAAKGIGGAQAATAIAALHDRMADPELGAAVAFARRRRLGPFRAGRAADLDEQRQRDLAAFARAGFTERTAETVLACSGPDAADMLLAERNRVE
jgi:regulatory protein